MSLLRTIINGTTIGIVSATFGMTLVIVAPLNSFGQQPGADVNQGLVRIVPENRVVPRPNRTRHVKAPPKPLPLADKQRILKSVLTSLQQQHQANPRLETWKVLPIKPGYPINLSFPTVLSPKLPWIDNVGLLIFSHAAYVGDYYNQTYYAQWGAQAGNPMQSLYSGLEVNLNASAGKTYLLDFTVSQFSVLPAAPMQIVVEPPPGGSNTNLEMGVTQSHILVPFVASTAGWYRIAVFCQIDWQFYSVQVNTLN